MLQKIEYGEQIIVATFFERNFKWFVTEREFWFLDYRQWAQAFLKAGYITGKRQINIVYFQGDIHFVLYEK